MKWRSIKHIVSNLHIQWENLYKNIIILSTFGNDITSLLKNITVVWHMEFMLPCFYNTYKTLDIVCWKEILREIEIAKKLLVKNRCNAF